MICWLIPYFSSFDFYNMFIGRLHGGMGRRSARRHTLKHLFKSKGGNVIWPHGNTIKGHWRLCDGLRVGIQVLFEENEEGEESEEGDDDEQEEMMEKPIRSHSKRIRFLCSSQATPRKVGKAKEKALVVKQVKG
jgi:hypothetical protein